MARIPGYGGDSKGFGRSVQVNTGKFGNFVSKSDVAAQYNIVFPRNTIILNL